MLGLSLQLLQTLHINSQLFVLTLQTLLVLLQVAFELHTATINVSSFPVSFHVLCKYDTQGMTKGSASVSRYEPLTLLACSSCSDTSSSAVPCLCLTSWIWASWFLLSSSMAFFSSATSCSRLDLECRHQIKNFNRRGHPP